MVASKATYYLVNQANRTIKTSSPSFTGSNGAYQTTVVLPAHSSGAVTLQ